MTESRPPHPLRYLQKTIWRYAGSARRRFALSYSLSLCAWIIELIKPLIFGTIINELQRGGEDVFDRLLGLLALYFSVPLAFWLFHGTARYLERTAAFEVVKNFQTRTFQMVTELPLKWQKEHHSGDTIDRLKKATAAISSTSQENYANISMVVRILGAFIAILWLSPVIGITMALCCILIWRISVFFDQRILHWIQAIDLRDHKVASTLHDYVTNIITVITLRLEKLSQTQVAKRIAETYEPWRRLVIVDEFKWFSVSMGVAAMELALVVGYLYQKTHSTELFLVGNFTMLVQYILQLDYAFFDFAWRYQDMVKESTHLQASEPLVADHAASSGLAVPATIEKWRQISIRNLNFTYRDESDEEQHLSEVALSIKRGQKIALVGESGSGKSTLMVLLRGLMPADSVELTVDGVAYDDLRVLRDVTTLIPQDPEIFENTIEYNITAGVTRHHEDVEIAAQLARFDDVVAALPDGYASKINEKGVNLSGGQKQRLALARGIFSAENSSLILMDEPTSSVDQMNEQKIYEGLFRHFASRCIISSVHKLHLLPLFDTVVVMAEGRVVEARTPKTAGHS